MDLHTVIFIGRSGCGKGTQAGLLKDRIYKHDLEKRKILYVETGEQFRQFIRGKSFSSKISNQIYENDDLQPTFLGCWMWTDMLVDQLEENMHLIFDGAPRSLPEALILNTALKFYKRERPIVVYINVSSNWSHERLLARGRSDDRTLSKINKRLEWFDSDVLPTIEFFEKNPIYKFIKVNGEQSIEKVHADIIAQYEHDKA